jgi:hypothetical protein
MKKVYGLLLFTMVLCMTGVTYDASAKEIAKVEVSKIEKSYTVTVAPILDNPFMVCPESFYQDDVFYSEQTAYENYTLQKIEEVYIEVAETPPNS